MHSLLAVAPHSGVVVAAHAGALKAFDLTRGGCVAWTQQFGESVEPSEGEHPPRKKRRLGSGEGESADANGKADADAADDASASGKAEVVDEKKTDESPKKRKKQARAAAPSPRPQDQLLATIRALEFSSDESHLFVCGDDKKVRMLSAKDGEVLGTRSIFKKPTALSLSPDNRSLLVSDKFGDVVTLNTGLGPDGSNSASMSDDDGPSILDKSQMLHRYGHLSLITDVKFITDKIVASCDRDNKIRVSRWPKTFIIENFCFGHKGYVTKLVVPTPPPASAQSSAAAMTDDDSAAPSEKPQPLLISSSADGHLRLWNYENGKELDSLDLRPSKTEFEVLISKERNESSLGEEKSSEAPAPQESSSSDAKSAAKPRGPRVPEAPDTSFVVTSMSYSQRHSMLVVITNRLKEFSLIDVDFVNLKLHLRQQVPLRGKPCDIAWREFHTGNKQDDGDARRIEDQVWAITEPSPSRLDVYEFDNHTRRFGERADNVAFDTISDELAKDVSSSVVHLYENLNAEERFSVDRQKRYEKSQKEKEENAIRQAEIKRSTDEKDIRREKDVEMKVAAIERMKARDEKEKAKEDAAASAMADA